jgi:uncharacterized membrane protein YkoI
MKMRRSVIGLGLGAAGCAGLVVPAGAGETCIADWSVAAGVVRKEGLATVEQLSQLARSSGAGEIVKTTLCEGEGSYRYRIVVKDGKGQLKSLVVDAKKPFAR